MRSDTIMKEVLANHAKKKCRYILFAKTYLRNYAKIEWRKNNWKRFGNSKLMSSKHVKKSP